MQGRFSNEATVRGVISFMTACLCVALLAIEARGTDDADIIDFARDVRPILSDTCYGCHGPDESARQAELRLDVPQEVFAKRDNGVAVSPGAPEHSLLYQRIRSTDPDLRMPPPDAPRQLSEQQIATLERWIESGARWDEHWAFVPPRKPPIPRVHDTSWPQSPIDYFVLARLESENLFPAPPTRRETWIRRVTLDLTGLPPTRAEVDAYLQDASPSADAKVVDRLLASPHFGERLAIDWLDAARYADTSGYQNDGPRIMWRWRDWVIDAFNANKPYDEFTVEQIAGDMLPGATRDQIIATAFNRNHRGNSEGGIIPEEYAVEYVVDRVETTFSVFLGLTMGCARCHDHKFDPLRQNEFYQAFAYFNNVPEYGRAIKEGNSPPYISAPTAQQEKRLAELDRAIADAERACAEIAPALDEAFDRWQHDSSSQNVSPMDWTIERDREAQFVFQSTVARSNGDTSREITFVGKEPAFADAPLGRSVDLDGQTSVDAGAVGDFGYFDKFSLSAWIYPDAAGGGTIVSRMTDAIEGDGYSLELKNGRIQFNLVKRWLDDSLRVESALSIPAHQWTHIAATYDGSRVAAGIALYINGQQVPINVHLDALNQSFATKEPLRIGAGGGPEARFHGRIADVRVYRRALDADEVAVISIADSVDDILRTPAGERTANQQQKLRAYYTSVAAPAEWRDILERSRSLQQQRLAFVEQIPTVMVMQESPNPRPTYFLQRGQYDQPGELVEPGVPACLPPLPAGVPNNRLGFARWLVDERQPLTARVCVNRYWQMLFGTGIVKTAEDFGVQGEAPSHPELLDWLATDFMESGWDLKRMLRQIVLSATYRQSSSASLDLWERDPENRLLARGPRFRLPAELVRDQALFVSGLLVPTIHGPSVKPYQPAGLWKEIATDVDYGQGHGADLYRRSVYTYWKRTVAPPTMTTFDAFSRETCMLRRSRTNTPLQALAAMNDVTFVEAARQLAERTLDEGLPSTNERLVWMFQQATARAPRAEEVVVLTRAFERNLERFRSNPSAAAELLSAGESPFDHRLDQSELAACTVVASLILNLDEVLTKE